MIGIGKNFKVLNRHDLIKEGRLGLTSAIRVRERVDTAADCVRSGEDLEMGLVGGGGKDGNNGHCLKENLIVLRD